MTPEKQLEKFLRELRYVLISLRMERKLNFADAASLAGLSRNGLEKIETGAALPSLESLFLLCEAYNIGLSDLIDTSLKKVPQNIKQELKSNSVAKKAANLKRSEAELMALLSKLKKKKQWELAEEFGKLSSKKQNALKTLMAK